MIYGDEVCNEMDCWVVTCYLTIKYNLEYSNGANIFLRIQFGPNNIVMCPS